MWLKRFNTRTVAELGNSLADHIVTSGVAVTVPRRPKSRQQGNELQTFFAQVDHQARPLQLGLFRRAKLANTFKWRLLEHGYDAAAADELTQMLLVRLVADESRAAADGVDPNTNTVSAPDSGRKPTSVQALVAKADACAARGAHAEVIECCEEVLRTRPRHLLARNNYGVALWRLGRLQEAAEQFRRAIGIQSTFAAAHFNLGNVLQLSGRMAESELPLRQAVKLDPKHVEALVSLGLTLTATGRLRDAQECFEKALKMAPGHANAWSGLGQVAALEGRFDAAETFCNRALKIDANTSSALVSLVNLRTMTKSDEAWRKSTEKRAGSGVPPLEEASLRFALGKYYDDTGNFERAFSNYNRGNELTKPFVQGYDPAARTRYIDDLIGVYTREALSAMVPSGVDSEKPVFVVGMMRSGTSLVEQIISSHPAAHGAGELHYWNIAAHKHEQAVRSQLLGESTRKKLAASYLRSLEGFSATALRVVDKMPNNADHLGLIHSVFPNARMIYVRRDPIDTCLSCYFQQFWASLNFTVDLADLAHYYREHQRLVAHWRAVLPPGTLLEVPYEELVADQEPWSRKIVDFLGLDWDERCLDFHQTKRAVLTSSFWQVRQKIYRTSVGRWRNYRKFIGPLLDLEGLDA